MMKVMSNEHPNLSGFFYRLLLCKKLPVLKVLEVPMGIAALFSVEKDVAI